MRQTAERVIQEVLIRTWTGTVKRTTGVRLTLDAKDNEVKGKTTTNHGPLI